VPTICILYREIRIENTLTDENGEPVGLKEGAQVEVTVEADSEDVEITFQRLRSVSPEP
jgi:hypothetical protein